MQVYIGYFMKTLVPQEHYYSYSAAREKHSQLRSGLDPQHGFPHYKHLVARWL